MIGRIGRSVSGQTWLALQIVFGVALLVLAVAVVAEKVKPDQGLVALALVLVVVVLAALRPTDVRELVGRLTEAGPVKFATKEAQTAADETVGVEADELDFQDTMLDLRMKLDGGRRSSRYVSRSTVNATAPALSPKRPPPLRR